MLKVLHIDAGNLYGGVEASLATLSVQHHWDTRLSRTFALCFKGRLSEKLGSDGENFLDLGKVRVRYPWTIWLSRRRLSAYLKKNHFDAVICHMPWALAAFGPVVKRLQKLALQSKKTNQLPVFNPPALIFWMHDIIEGTHWVERWAGLTKPDLVIINSQFTALSLPRLFPIPPPHVVIHGPTLPFRGTLTISERAAVRAKLNTPSQDIVIIQISRMEPYKGHVLHLEALEKLSHLPGWSCWIVGGAQREHEKTYLAELKAQVAAAGLVDRVHFLGERKDVPQLLGAADIFCQPNLRGEPFGLVFVEALSAGLPVISTAIGGVLEIVDQTCGLLTEPGSAEALAAALRELITQPERRQQIGAHGPARAVALSDPDVVLSKLEAALLDLLKTR